MAAATIFSKLSIPAWSALENTQREVNIALMNQMMALFDKMGIRSTEIIATGIAAARFKIAIGTGCTNNNANRVAWSDIDNGGNSGLLSRAVGRTRGQPTIGTLRHNCNLRNTRGHGVGARRCQAQICEGKQLVLDQVRPGPSSTATVLR
jgi:hypothetical protein